MKDILLYSTLNKMKQIIVILIVGVLVILAGLCIFYHKDNFDITVDPVRFDYQTADKTFECSPPNLPKGGGLIMSSGGPSFEEFEKKYKDSIPKPEGAPYRAVLEKYCAFMYENYHDDFTTKWHTISECEQSEGERLGL